MYVLTETMNVDAAGGISGRRIYPVGGTVLVELKGVGGDEILTDIARGDESTDVHQVSGNIFRWTVPVTQDGLEPAERTPYAYGRVEIIDAQSDSLMAVGFTNAWRLRTRLRSVHHTKPSIRRPRRGERTSRSYPGRTFTG